MALDATKFRTIVGGAQQLHLYDAGADAVATAIASGYFNSITDRLKNKDVIICIAATNTAVDVLFVNSATGAATVTTVNGT